MSEIKRIVNDWIQTQYELDVALVGRVINPERERDYEAGYLAGLKRGFEAAREQCITNGNRTEDEMRRDATLPPQMRPVGFSVKMVPKYKTLEDLLKAMESEK